MTKKSPPHHHHPHPHYHVVLPTLSVLYCHLHTKLTPHWVLPARLGEGWYKELVGIFLFWANWFEKLILFIPCYQYGELIQPYIITLLGCQD